MDTSTNNAKVQPFAMDALTEQKGDFNLLYSCFWIINHLYYFLVYVPWVSKKWETALVYLEENRQHVFYVLGFYVITIALFIERFMRKYFFMPFTLLSSPN